MTLKQAIKTGLPFKRPMYGAWVIINNNPELFFGDELFIFEDSLEAKGFDAEDIFATDYQVKHVN